MDSSALYGSLHALLSDKTVAQLFKTMIARYIAWDDFRAMELSFPTSTPETWTLLKLLGRSAGLEIPIPDHAGNEYWYLRTHEIADASASIQCLCRSDSDLHGDLTVKNNRRVLVRSRIEETVAAARLDGLDIDPLDATLLLQQDHKPRTATERLLRNTLAAMSNLDRFLATPFSPELFDALRETLLDGVDTSDLRVVEPRCGIMTAEYREEEVRLHADTQLRYICDYYNHSTGDTHDHVVLRALLLPDLFRFYRPLPDLNSEVGRLAFHLYALKIKLPVLGHLPLSQAKLRWETGTSDPSVSLDRERYLNAREHDGTDITGYFTLSVQLALSALRDLAWSLRELEQHDEDLRSLLQSAPLLNHRQRSILGHALRNPSSEFRISHHRTTHSVVYATARSDLLGLVDKGYLEISMQGREMVFTPRPGLHTIIERDMQDM